MSLFEVHSLPKRTTNAVEIKETPSNTTSKNFDHTQLKRSLSFFTSPFGFFALIADPKVVIVTEKINSNEKTKLARSMVNLENNKNNVTTLISSGKMLKRLPESPSKRFRLTLVTNVTVVKRQLKYRNLSYCF